MSKINVLDAQVFNQISAGEVVERPASVVKELVENSIDAGASKIDVQIFDGGINKIIIMDNGSGIDPDDIETAFLPHATSKLKEIKDLDSLVTLGFRGEALASIASVTNVEVISKTVNANGQSIKLSGGKVIAKGEKGSPQGTYFCVENLFFNTPARQKFLKTPKKEESEITTLMARLILANPNISFKYSADNKVIYNSSGNGVEDAIFSIYGAETLQNLVQVNQKLDDYTITGYIGKTSYFKPNRTYQTIIINGRWVADSIVGSAISQSYESYMMKHCFPFCVIYLNLPSEQVDVNVHPNKLEVRFQDSRKVFGFVYNAISNSLLDDISKKMNLEIHPNENLNNTEFANEPKLNYSISTAITEKTNMSKETVETNKNEVVNTNLDFLLQRDDSRTNLNINTSQNSVLNEIVIEKLSSTNGRYNFGESSSKKVEPKPIQTQLVSDEIQDKNKYLSTKIVGKLFNTFILLEIDDNVYIVDQHAAHERLLYDKYVKQVREKGISYQSLLLPYTLTVNHTEEQFILDNLDLLKQLGFEIDLFGAQKFKITTIPSTLPDLNISNFFENFLSNVNSFVKMNSIDLILDNLAETACKHAVKGGDDLNKEELIKLISDFSDGSITLQCPHGRPFLVKLTRKDFDKWFKRTV